MNTIKNKSILIVDTPKNCNDCVFCSHDPCFMDFASCRASNFKVLPLIDGKIDRPKWCPLIDSTIENAENVYKWYRMGFLNALSVIQKIVIDKSDVLKNDFISFFNSFHELYEEGYK